MSVYKAKKEWRKWNEMVSNSLNAIEDFRDFADDRAIVRADKKIQSLRSKKYNLERQLEEAREENYKLEKIIQDFDGSVRYLMTVAPQLDNILKNNLSRLKGKGGE